MKVLKTIVATAAIVFALTTVTVAGVQHFTKQGGQATGTQAQTAQPTYTVTLSATQLSQLMNGGKAASTGGVHHARQAQQHATAARHKTSSHDAGDTTHAVASGSGGTNHYEATYHGSASSSSTCIHHADASQHSGGCGDSGGSCRD